MDLLTREKRQEIKQQDREKLKEIGQKAETIRAVRLDELQKRHEKIMAQLEKLKDEKEELLSIPMCKDEYLQLAKNEYHNHKKEFALGMLKEHLAANHCQRGYPFVPTDIKVHSLTDSNFWKLFFLVFTDQDIEEAIAPLPEKGISSKERDKKIKEIDKQIEELSKLLDNDLKEAGSPANP